MMSEFEIKRAEKLKREALNGNPIPRKLSDYAASVNNNEKD